MNENAAFWQKALYNAIGWRVEVEEWPMRKVLGVVLGAVASSLSAGEPDLGQIASAVEEAGKRVGIEQVMNQFVEGSGQLTNEAAEMMPLIPSEGQLKEKLKHALVVIKKAEDLVNDELKQSDKSVAQSESELSVEDVFTELANLTANGFYDVCRREVDDLSGWDYSSETLSVGVVFDHLWQCLWQAKDTVEYIKLKRQGLQSAKCDRSDVGACCYEVRTLLKGLPFHFDSLRAEAKGKALKIGDRFWELSVYFGNKSGLINAGERVQDIQDDVACKLDGSSVKDYVLGEG